MNYEMRNNNFDMIYDRNKQEVLSSSLPLSNGNIENHIAEISSEEATERLNSDKYAEAILNPEGSKSFISKLLKEKRGSGQEYFNSVVRFAELSGVSYDYYQEVLSGKKDDPDFRGKFAKASVEYEKALRASVTSEEMKSHLYHKIFNAVMGDYHSLVWQLL